MSGRGYNDEGYRCVVVNYSFGTYSTDEKQLIINEHSLLCNIEWVGGKIGRKENLNESSIKIKSVKSLNRYEQLYRKICSYLPDL